MGRDAQPAKLLEFLWLCVVFLFSMNFMGMRMLLLVGLFFVGFLNILQRKTTLKSPIDLAFITLFSISYYVIFSLHTSFGFGFMILLAIGPMLCFAIGYFIVDSNKNFISKTLIAIVLGTFAYGFLNMRNYFQIYGFSPQISGIRAVPDFWTGHPAAATLFSTDFTLISSLLLYSLIIFQKFHDAKIRFLGLVIFLSVLFTMFSSAIMGNRSIFFIIMGSFCLSLLVYFNLTEVTLKEYLRVGSILSILLSIIFYLYSKNWLGIQTFVLDSTVFARFQEVSILEDARVFRYQRAIGQIFEYPFGGFIGHGYAHNLWLDVLQVAGYIPFFFLLLFTLKSLKNLGKFLKIKGVDSVFKIFVFSIYSGYFINFLVEPILEGRPFMFLTFCMFNGMVLKYLNTHRYFVVSHKTT